MPATKTEQMDLCNKDPNVYDYPVKEMEQHCKSASSSKLIS